MVVCLSVFPHDISETDAARITRRDIEIEMFHRESWKSIYFGVKGSKVKVMSHENIAGMGRGTLMSAGFI